MGAGGRGGGLQINPRVCIRNGFESLPTWRGRMILFPFLWRYKWFNDVITLENRSDSRHVYCGFRLGDELESSPTHSGGGYVTFVSFLSVGGTTESVGF